MSKFISFCCAICGKDLYTSFKSKEKEPKYIEYYVINTTKGEEQICPKCFEKKA